MPFFPCPPFTECERLRPAAASAAQVGRSIPGHRLKRVGLTRTIGHTGAVTLIQCFGSALNLNIHFHMRFLDGVYVIDEAGQRAKLEHLCRNVSRPPVATERMALTQEAVTAEVSAGASGLARCCAA
jgi:hypothetical protein